MSKISWLDSCDMESNIHVTEDGIKTLCGYPFFNNFGAKIWRPYRSGRHKNRCQTCFNAAKKQHINTKNWHELCPERDFTEIPNHILVRKKI